MPQSFCRLICASLALGALSALPALADTPAAPVTSTVQAAQKIVLQHVVPSDVIKTLHWDQPANLPAGVTQVLPVPLQTALLVTATPAGLAQVREIVKLLDIAPRQVQIKFTLAQATDADLKASGIGFDQYAIGLPAVRFLQLLTKQGSVTLAGIITTTNNVSASSNTSFGPAASDNFAVTPRVNNDNSLTLALHPIFTEGAVTHELSVTRTIPSGGTMLFVMSPPSPDGKSLLLFVAPTLVK